MSLLVKNLITIVISYLVGSISPAIILGRARGIDIKKEGSGNAGTDHFSSTVVHTGNEIENLSLVMADMEKDLAEYEKNLTKVTAEKERISTELSLATRIQADMLPNIYPPFPDRHEFEQDDDENLACQNVAE